MATRLDLLTVGEAFEDLVFSNLPRLPRLGEELRARSLSFHLGGGAAITAIGAARLGQRVGIVSALAPHHDALLVAESVTVTNLRRAGERTAVTAALSTARDRAFVTFDGVNQQLEARLLAWVTQLTTVPRHLHFALLPRRMDRWSAALASLRRRGATTSWDFGWHEQLPANPAFSRLLTKLDWVLVNEREARHYSGQSTLPRALHRWSRELTGAVIKCGARGAMVVTGGQRYEARARRASVRDTTGAGDAFNAGFLTAWIRGATPADALRLGNYLGACCVRAAGGSAGLPVASAVPAWAKLMIGQGRFTS